MFIQQKPKTDGNYAWYGVKHPIRAVCKTYPQCWAIVNKTYRPCFQGFYSWYAAAFFVYWDWAFMAIMLGILFGYLFFT